MAPPAQFGQTAAIYLSVIHHHSGHISTILQQFASNINSRLMRYTKSPFICRVTSERDHAGPVTNKLHHSST
jgi:hypothetical protein